MINIVRIPINASCLTMSIVLVALKIFLRNVFMVSDMNSGKSNHSILSQHYYNYVKTMEIIYYC
jgi:hypothetical protein